MSGLTISASKTATPAGCKARVLVVDDDMRVGEALREYLLDEGYVVDVCADGREAMKLLVEAESQDGEDDAEPRGYQLVVSDVSMPDVNGLDLLQHITEHHPSVVTVLLTGFGTIETAVEAIRSGAFDYLAKPVVDEELAMVLERALKQQRLLEENSRLRRDLSTKYGLGALVGADERMHKAFDMVRSVAGSKATVLMTGESGTGKSVIARTLHQMSPRAEAPFVEIHCGSIPEALLESELFGHVKGAFTGAHADKRGKFIAADGGTIFIDEINSASPAMQLKLLRVLQERSFEPIGSNETVEVDVRVVLAANEPLEHLVREGRFREDLYYRINVVRIELPPLRERPADVGPLAEHFLAKFNDEHGTAITGFGKSVIEALRRYPMPGNVRELANIVERAVVLASGDVINVEDLPPFVTDREAGGSLLMPHVRAGLSVENAIDSPDTPWIPTPLAEAMKGPERRIILKALRANDWNRQQTADDLDINRTTLYKKMKAYDLDEDRGS